MNDKFGPPNMWTEHQVQAIQFLSNAIERMRQEGMSEYDIVFWFQNFIGPYLENLYGLKIYIGSVSSNSSPVEDIKPIYLRNAKG